MNNKDSIAKYFHYFSSKNSQYLSSLFSEDILLCDWNISVVGKSMVLEKMDGIFASAKTITAIPKLYFENSDYLYAIQVDIVINNETIINVIDVIEFNSEGKISKIVAFKF